MRISDYAVRYHRAMREFSSIFVVRKFLRMRFAVESLSRSRRFGRLIQEDRGDVPGWVLVVLMTTGLVTAIWTIAAPRLSAILRNSLDSMNAIR